MKTRLLSLLRLSSVLLIMGLAAAPLHAADTPKLERTIDLLQSAKTSSEPMPLLERARKQLTAAKKGNKAGERDEAVEKLDEAIAELKAGDRKKMEQKINAAIFNINGGKNKVK